MKLSKWGVGSCAWGLAIGVGAGIAACSAPPAPPSDAAADATVICTRAADCANDAFCDGVETCSPGAAGAGPDGCVAGTPPCAAGTCDESSDRCAIGCETSDADGDGHAATSCGGDDCADGDALRHPGLDEICDSDAHDEDCDPSTFGERDVDGDGSLDAACCNVSPDGSRTCGLDCDDLRRSTNPSAPEVCDGLDNDCDDGTDEGFLVESFRDSDHDGVGGGSRELACPGTPGYADVGGDCDDESPATRPTASEICDAADNDCDGTIDENAIPVPWYVDADADGWGMVSAASPSMSSCSPLAGRAIRLGDCDDQDAMVSPTAHERCNAEDDDCDGLLDFVIAAGDFEDDDGDGVPDALCGAVDADCDDADPFAGTAATPEICDGRDNDCDTRTDEGTASVPWYADLDGDRYGDDASVIMSCEILAGRVRRGGDCDDTVASTRPSGVDACGGSPNIDDDCDGMVDEGGNRVTVYADLDGDGWGAGPATMACQADARTSTMPGDCDDTDFDVSPDAIDDCASQAGVDDDCDMAIDETTTPRIFYADADGDGHGAGAPMSGCAQPPGTSTTNDDCDDADRSRNPEVPDDCGTRLGVDDDCDVSVDEALALRTFYLDGDRDGYGAGSAMTACTIPSGAVLLAGDCDDTAASRNPGAPDDCSRTDFVDDDCDGRVDEAATRTTYYVDADADSYGAGAPISACFPPSGHVARAGDCDDASPARNPLVPDDCAHVALVDDDCDGMIDEAATLSSFYRDTDGDGYGSGAVVRACTAPIGHVTVPGDCDESTVNRNPGRVDDCMGVAMLDDDCDTRVDEAATPSSWYSDGDGDGYGTGVAVLACVRPTGHAALTGDCADTNAQRNPGRADNCATSIGTDDDCDGAVDEAVVFNTYYRDADGDGFGTPTLTSSACLPPTGYVTTNTDCDDTRAVVRPTASEVCGDGLDNECDGLADCAETSCAASCGSIQLVSGFPLTGAVHTVIPTPLVVRVVDGLGVPVAGRTVTIVTESVTGSPGLSAITDSMGLASFNLRAGLPLGAETVHIRAAGMTEATTTVTATAPAAGTLFSATNGLRVSASSAYPGPAFTSSAANVALGRMATAPDGAMYVAIQTIIYRVAPNGVVAPFVGGGTTALADGVLASSVNLLTTNANTLAYDGVHDRLLFAQDNSVGSPCSLWSVDQTTRIVTRIAGTGVCGHTGNGGAATLAQIRPIADIAVTSAGIVYFIEGTTSDTSRGTVVRSIDAAGVISRVIDDSSSSPGVTFYAGNPNMTDLDVFPGSNDFVLSAYLLIAGSPRMSILRVTPSGGLTRLIGGGADLTTDPIMPLLADVDPAARVTVLADGRVVYGEQGANDRIRILGVDGLVRTVTGVRGMAGDTGDGGPAAGARIDNPYAVQPWLGSHIAFFDLGARAIRVVW